MPPQDAIRTCIGCRRKAPATELLRVVATPGTTGGTPSGREPIGPRVEPDPRRRLPGRGAWVHRDPACVALAERRRAFGRALRVSEPLDPAAVVEHVATHYGVGEQVQDRQITSASPQETKS